MSTQTINLGNMNEVKFNGQNVEVLYLNSTKIWEAKDIVTKTVERSISQITDANMAGITVIGAYAFSGCQNLTSVNFASTDLVTISSGAFSNCSSLETVDFSNCPNLENIQWEYIQWGAFRDCTSLKYIDLSGTKVSSFGSLTLAALSLLPLEIIKLPSTTASITTNFNFIDNTANCTLYVYAETPPTFASLSTDTMHIADSITSIRVPANSVSDYQNADVWSEKASIITSI